MSGNGVVWAPIRLRPDGNLVVLDADRRLYAALDRDDRTYHVVQPKAFWEETGPDRDQAGLMCSCTEAHFTGRCWAIAAAEMFEGQPAHDAAARVPWIQDIPAGAGESVEAWRG
jgi:hypothetical protein